MDEGKKNSYRTFAGYIYVVVGLAYIALSVNKGPQNWDNMDLFKMAFCCIMIGVGVFRIISSRKTGK